MAHKAEIDLWSAPPIWCNQTVVVIGGGPSLLKFAIKKLRHHNCIAVNNAFMIAPWAKFLVFHDLRWANWHLKAVEKYTGTRVTTNAKSPPILAKRMRKDRSIAINVSDRTCLAGIDSGTQGVNLAFHLGATTIALAGFDMGFADVTKFDISQEKLTKLQTPLKRDGFETPANRAVDPTVLKHWHQEHPIPPRATNYVRFLAQYPKVIRTLKSQGVKLVTLTRTRIDIPKVKINDL